MEEIAARMLQGWKMLAQHCPVCSTVLIGKDEQIYCAACKASCVYEDSTTSGPQSKIVAESDKTMTGKTADQFFSELMLNGWVMVDDVCTKAFDASGKQERLCSYPLLQDSKGRKICASCDANKDLHSPPSQPKQQIHAAANKISTESSAPDQVPAMAEAEFQDFRRRRDRTSAELGARLLQGWAMLDRSCPNGCGTPLMKKQASGEEECVACSLDKEPQEEAKQVPSPAQQNQPLPGYVSFDDLGAGGAKNNNNDGSDSEAEEPSAAAASGPRATGPPPRPPAAAAAPAPAFAHWPRRAEAAAAGAPQRAAAAGAGAAAAGGGGGEDGDGGGGDDASAALGAKLLAGWALLGDACPRPGCATPLMRDHERRIWCLKCRDTKGGPMAPAPAPTAAPAEATVPQAPPPTNANKTPTSSRPVTAPPGAAALAEEKNLKRKVMVESANDKTRKTLHASTIAHPSNDVVDESSAEINQTMAMLFQEINSTKERMQQSRSLEEKIHCAQLIQESAKAIKCLEALL